MYKYDSTEKVITLNCNSIITLKDIDKQLNDPQILQEEDMTASNHDASNNDAKVVWILNAGIIVGNKATLYINNTDTSWLKIVADGKTAHPIEVIGSAKIDSVKITSWNPETNDYAKTTGDDDAIPRPYIKIAKEATGSTEIINSEIAYLGYSEEDCSRCSGLGFYGGDGSILKGNYIHHIWNGFYSKEVGDMIIEGNNVHNNNKYGLDPHTGTHDMVIRKNVVHDNGATGIICSLDCYNITIEGNEVYNNDNVKDEIGSRGIALSRNNYDSVVRNNLMYDQGRCIVVNRESNNNEIYANVVSDCKVGIIANSDANNNKIYNNTIMDSTIALAVNSSAYDNAFYSNIIINSKEFEIMDSKEDSDTSSSGSNSFENNKLINSKASSEEEEYAIIKILP